MEWGAIAVGIIIGYRFVRRRMQRYRLENGLDEEEQEDEWEDPER